ncbi:MAG: glutamate 5-kinase [Chlamydiales bacterium]|nr:glutamate 5-kinase [Chlamydiales bacterium]
MKKKIVIKLGSSSLTNGTSRLSRSRMIELVRQVSFLHEQGHEIVLVSSGAIAAAREHFPAKSVGDCIPSKQMLASIGQVCLIQTWSELFSIYDLFIGQLLLTKHDFSNSVSAANAKATFETMLMHRVIPIVNENDTLATDEIRVGDNDNLSALVAHMIGADLLILLTDQEGLFTADPRHNPDAQLIQVIDSIDETISGCAKETNPNGLGTGGMITKLQAAKFATQKGTATVIASAKTPNVILDLISGKKVGTLFSI